MLRATHSGVLRLGSIELDAHVLEDGTAVLSQTQLVRTLTGKDGWRVEALKLDPAEVSGNLVFGRRKSLAFRTVEALQTIDFQNQRTGTPAKGFTSDHVIAICQSLVAGLQTKDLTPRQTQIAAQAAVLLGACAGVGLKAIIHEACGYKPAPTEYRNTLHEQVAKIAQQVEALTQLTHTVRPRSSKPPITLTEFILGKIKNAGPRGLTTREITRATQKHPRWIRQEVLAQLVESEQISIHPNGKTSVFVWRPQ